MIFFNVTMYNGKEKLASIFAVLQSTGKPPLAYCSIIYIVTPGPLKRSQRGSGDLHYDVCINNVHRVN